MIPIKNRIQNKAIFFDRDGVVNKRLVGDYVKSVSEFIFNDEIFSAIKTTKENGLLAILITNQRCIGRKIITTQELALIHDFMQKNLTQKIGANFDAIYFCPHEIFENCTCRKPKPGMLLQASEDFNINLKQSFMIGDSLSDIEAGNVAGCKTGFLIHQENSVKNMIQDIEPIPNYTSSNVNKLLNYFLTGTSEK